MFKRVLIANRGAIAVRICRTLKQMGVESVAVYSDADQHSLHRSAADLALPLGSGSASQTYLDAPRLIQLMKEHQVDAVHPGYGFLSENAGFAEACEEAGIAFIGPTGEQMRQFGLKHTARSLAKTAGVPLLEGSELLDNADQAADLAAGIGYPVMLKSTAGGGGIGMQVCRDEAQLRQVFESTRQLSANNFSNDGLFLEKFIERARHIEVQVFGDGKGGAVAIGERDCSAQRRHQKVVEECPAPNLPQPVREQLHSRAAQLAASVNYRNAGTVEFIYDADSDQFWFLEVNTRLQVEHGVTEAVYGIDLVECMVRLAANELTSLEQIEMNRPSGHAIQARIYAEDPCKNFQPSAGLLTRVELARNPCWRLDSWVETGTEVSALYDPLLAKLIVHQKDRRTALAALDNALSESLFEGIETNRKYIQAILADPTFERGETTTTYLNEFNFSDSSIDVLQPGTLTTVQDYPGRIGYWHVGVPPSGPFDSKSFRIANRLLGNPPDAAGLEITLNGPTLRFNHACRIAISGGKCDARLDGHSIGLNTEIQVVAGQTLSIGKVTEGARCYLAIEGGLRISPYLGSRSTFTLGQFGGHGGRSLRTGDVLHFPLAETGPSLDCGSIPFEATQIKEIRVIYGPHGAPDFFNQVYIDTFFDSEWEVHYNSSRTGVRLIGPKPDWARTDGGEAGMHPSNIHDNAYAIGAIDFTGDMPVILGPDGPSLGGFVCPATVIRADLWKLGQLKAGDKFRFVPVSLDNALEILAEQENQLGELEYPQLPAKANSLPLPILSHRAAEDANEQVTYRAAGDSYLLVEYGPMVLDLRLRFRVHALMLSIQDHSLPGILELTPGIRSLQVHYDSLKLNTQQLLDHLQKLEKELGDLEQLSLPSRIVHLPLSWNDSACQLAVEKYMQSVRKDAPWCPDNIEFIRRINGLESVDEVREILFDASYVVMGLGDVYLGAPVATPLDPRHRLVTTKYNPARTWTAENSVGIGGSYLCVYGMEGPGGYQFVGRTLQMWNRFHHTADFQKPWLLRFFDQIRFYPVSEEELRQIREDFPRGRYPLKIAETRFSIADYNQFLEKNAEEIDSFSQSRQAAFDQELQRWIASGQINFQSSSADRDEPNLLQLEEGLIALDSPVAGSLWKQLVHPGERVKAGQVLGLLESMKMEIELTAHCDGKLMEWLKQPGQGLASGQAVLTIRPEDK